MIDGLEKSIDRLIEGVKTKIYGNTFRCPVCHLELSMHDVNGKGLVVCPLCGIVIEVTTVFGHILAVVHDVEIKRHQPKMRLHPLSTHIPLGLFPFSFLLSLLLLLASFIFPFIDNQCFLGSFYHYLSALANISQFMLITSVVFLLPAFFTGLYDWYFRYEKRRYRTIDIKIVCSLIFLVLALIAFFLQNAGLVFSAETGLIATTFENIVVAAIYFLLMFVSLIILATIGHLGGLLVFGK